MEIEFHALVLLLVVTWASFWVTCLFIMMLVEPAVTLCPQADSTSSSSAWLVGVQLRALNEDDDSRQLVICVLRFGWTDS